MNRIEYGSSNYRNSCFRLKESYSKYSEEYFRKLKYHSAKINYSKFGFVSVFEPKQTESNSILKNKIKVEDLNFFHGLVNKSKSYLSFLMNIEIRKFNFSPPRDCDLLPEPLPPEFPRVELLAQELREKGKPVYRKVEIKNRYLIKFLKSKFLLLENFLNVINELVYKNKIASWKSRLKKLEQDKLKDDDYKIYRSAFEIYKVIYEKWRDAKDFVDKDYSNSFNSWNLGKSSFEEAARTEFDKLMDLKKRYSEKTQKSIEEITYLILMQSSYPKIFPRCVGINYDIESKILIVDFELPDFEKIELYESSSRRNDKSVGSSRKKNIAENVYHSITIRTLYEIAVNDPINAIKSIVFNGWVNFINKTNGHANTEYIISVHALKEDILNLEVENIDPKKCFIAMKGIAAKNIWEYIPVAPILIFNKDDNRLIEGRPILNGLNPGDNLAAINWNDFEHLIRELFEKEYSEDGIEVKITQASHDRGVDAIIYDPHPIKGGRTIIQAKRYTKLVDVSSVRDLYGAVQNEGANKGILVTTSRYGAEAYEFAKDKNLTLLDGSSLLHLLKKHGYNFRIDIEEARKLLNLN